MCVAGELCVEKESEDTQRESGVKDKDKTRPEETCALVLCEETSARMRSGWSERRKWKS